MLDRGWLPLGCTFTYEVRSNQLVSERNLRVLADSDYTLVNLTTCETYNEGSGEYLYRQEVQAVLVAVDKIRILIKRA